MTRKQRIEKMEEANRIAREELALQKAEMAESQRKWDARIAQGKLIMAKIRASKG